MLALNFGSVNKWEPYVLHFDLRSRGKQSLSSDWRSWVFIVVFAALYFAFAS